VGEGLFSKILKLKFKVLENRNKNSSLNSATEGSGTINIMEDIMSNVEVRETGEREFMESTFGVYGLFVNNQEVHKDATQIQVLHECQGKDGGVVAVYYAKRAIDIYIPTLYKQAAHRSIQERKGCGVQYVHDLTVVCVNGGEVAQENLMHFNDSGMQPEEWALDTHAMAGAELVVTFGNRYQPERSNSQTFDLSKFVSAKAETTGKLNVGRVKALITQVSTHLGYDYCYDPDFPKERKDICAIRYLSENGSTYGFDTIYLVWKDKDGEIHHRELTNSRSTKDYLSVNKIYIEKGEVVVEVSHQGTFRTELSELDLS